MNQAEKQIRIAGPCAVESKEQWREVVTGLRDRCDVIRGGVWKPRTRPGWDGLGEKILAPMFEIATEHGITPAMEVLVPEHVDAVVDAMRLVGGNSDEAMKVIVWIGSRNQNHMMQQDIGERVHNSPSGMILGLKNAPWASIDHTVGIVEHVMASGLPQERIAWLALRGFDPGIFDVIGGWNEGTGSVTESFNPNGLRNIPPNGRWVGKLQAGLKSKGLSIPLIIDPSHIAGRADLVPDLLVDMMQAMKGQIAGFITEVHPNPTKAQTDSRQQLNVEEFLHMMNLLQEKNLMW